MKHVEGFCLTRGSSLRRRGRCWEERVVGQALTFFAVLLMRVRYALTGSLD